MNLASEAGFEPGFVMYNEKDLEARELIIKTITFNLKKDLGELNRAIRFFQIETPITTPRKMLQGHIETGFEMIGTAEVPKNIDDKPLSFDKLLRPETTAGTYAAFYHMFGKDYMRVKKMLPVVLWQFGKSFRSEQLRPLSGLRFQEFYQLEYQLFYAADSGADYFTCARNSAVKSIAGLCGSERWSYMSVDKDSLAHYAEKTTDIFVDVPEIEVGAISQRKDFHEYVKVVEVSIGLDRLTALQTVLRDSI